MECGCWRGARRDGLVHLNSRGRRSAGWLSAAEPPLRFIHPSSAKRPPPRQLRRRTRRRTTTTTRFESCPRLKSTEKKL